MGKIALRLTKSHGYVRSPYTPEKAESLAKLIRLQPYITSCEYSEKKEAFNLDGWRYSQKELIIDMFADFLKVETDYSPWLQVEKKEISPVVINRTFRYRNSLFPWKDVVGKYKDAIFIGNRDEYKEFGDTIGKIDYYPTETLLDAAQIIAGSSLFIGNQSCLGAIAIGLGARLIQETDASIANCVYPRDNAQYVFGSSVDLI